MTQNMLIKACIYIVVPQQKYLQNQNIEMNKKSLNSLKPDKFKKLLPQFLSSFKRYFFKLCLKVIRFLVRLNVFGVLFQKVGPIYDKAS